MKGKKSGVGKVNVKMSTPSLTLPGLHKPKGKKKAALVNPTKIGGVKLGFKK